MEMNLFNFNCTGLVPEQVADIVIDNWPMGRCAKSMDIDTEHKHNMDMQHSNSLNTIRHGERVTWY